MAQKDTGGKTAGATSGARMADHEPETPPVGQI